MYALRIEIDEEKVKSIMDRLEKAKQEIYDCYSELEMLEVVTLKKAATDADDSKEIIA